MACAKGEEAVGVPCSSGCSWVWRKVTSPGHVHDTIIREGSAGGRLPAIKSQS